MQLVCRDAPGGDLPARRGGRGSRADNRSMQYARGVQAILLAFGLSACSPTFDWRELTFPRERRCG